MEMKNYVTMPVYITKNFEEEFPYYGDIYERYRKALAEKKKYQNDYEIAMNFASKANRKFDFQFINQLYVYNDWKDIKFSYYFSSGFFKTINECLNMKNTLMEVI